MASIRFEEPPANPSPFPAGFAVCVSGSERIERCACTGSARERETGKPVVILAVVAYAAFLISATRRIVSRGRTMRAIRWLPVLAVVLLTGTSVLSDEG